MHYCYMHLQYNAKIKKEIVNWVLFWPKNEWNPHSKAVFFSIYGLWDENKKLIVNKRTATMIINRI